jgi:ankyrin repeat protein
LFNDIDAQVDVNLQNKSGYTALMCATNFSITGNTVSMLMERSNPNLQNKRGNTALMILLKYNLTNKTINVAKNLMNISSLYLKNNEGDSAGSLIAKLPYHKIFLLFEEQYCSPVIDDNSCNICSDDGSLIKLKCEHIYHRKCLLRKLKKTNRCPTCHYHIL